VPGTSLLAYGDGDWNDSLQPARPEMRESMVSTWTVELFYQALRGWARVLRARGEDAAAKRAEQHEATAAAIRDDVNQRLVLDGETVGLYLHDDDPAQAKALLHPRDTETGVRHRLLPMIRGILSGLFTKEQAEHHAGLIKQHLLAPDGARLMDRPPHYDGGRMTHFQRLESASFFGREIGLMYTHAHLRYAEAMARLGRAEEVAWALLAVNPVGLAATVPNAAPRQANAYFSSSDAEFVNRADSEARYEALMRGEVPVHGGWRVYSSGPGIYVGLLLRRWLGLRRRYDRFVFDPVLSAEYDGLEVGVELAGVPTTVTFRVSGGGVTESVTVDGEPLATVGREENPYRTGGLCVEFAALQTALRKSSGRLVVNC
jgi:cellobiose phosphorylase